MFIIGVIYLVVWTIKAIIRSATNAPTWSGIIINAILGMLPFYLILCFFGFMGEARNASSMDNNKQSQTETYAEQMSRRYAYEKTSKKKRNWFNYVVLAFVAVSLFYILNPYKSDEQETTTTLGTSVPENVASEETKEETPAVIVKKKSVNQKQTPKKKTSNPKMEKPLVESKRDIVIESTKPELKISQEENKGTKTHENTKSTLELLEERNHANVVKQAKEAGVSTDGSTLEILERINHASVVKQAKEAGVSTEGSTLEILERINRKVLEDYLK